MVICAPYDDRGPLWGPPWSTICTYVSMKKWGAHCFICSMRCAAVCAVTYNMPGKLFVILFVISKFLPHETRIISYLGWSIVGGSRRLAPPAYLRILVHHRLARFFSYFPFPFFLSPFGSPGLLSWHFLPLLDLRILLSSWHLELDTLTLLPRVTVSKPMRNGEHRKQENTATKVHKCTFLVQIDVTYSFFHTQT